MKVFYLQPITDAILTERLHREMGEDILGYHRISSTHKKEPYEPKNELDLKYLERAKGIINDVGDFIRGFLPGFFSSQRSDFDYVRKRNVEFLKRHKVLIKVSVQTEREKKELLLNFDLPSSVYLPRMLCRFKKQYVYLHNHLASSISFIIGNRENPKTDNYFIEDAMEELWHLALHPYLIEKLNRNLQRGTITPPHYDMAKILMEGESLAKAFACVSFDEFTEKKRYNFPSVETKDREKILVDRIKSVRIKRALKVITRPGIFQVPCKR